MIASTKSVAIHLTAIVVAPLLIGYGLYLLNPWVFAFVVISAGALYTGLRIHYMDYSSEYSRTFAYGLFLLSPILYAFLLAEILLFAGTDDTFFLSIDFTSQFLLFEPMDSSRDIALNTVLISLPFVYVVGKVIYWWTTLADSLLISRLSLDG
jgi:hypothetical protein